MTKLAKVQAARPVVRKVASAPAPRRNVRKVDSAWVEFAEHVLIQKLPLAPVAVELGKCLQDRRLSLRAALLVAALAI
ncbi:MAG TPA: hypothetical protein VEH76_12490 [Methylocystis sp.]|nr:hypothetical protein [Methylocystis sp.]